MRAFTWLIGVLRAVIRWLMTRRERVYSIEKILRGSLMVPVFGVMLILLRLRAKLLGPLRIETTTAEGDRVACHLPDLIQMYLYVFGVWEPDLAAYIRSRLNEGDVCVDVGANIGFDTLIASRKVGPSGGVVAIEASPLVAVQMGTLICYTQKRSSFGEPLVAITLESLGIDRLSVSPGCFGHERPGRPFWGIAYDKSVGWC